MIHPDALALIKRQEKFMPEAYPDGDWPAKGYGHSIRPPEVDDGLPWTEEHASEVLLADIAERIKPLEGWLDERSIRLTDKQIGALVSFIFNRGWTGFKGTKLAQVLQSTNEVSHLIKVTCHFPDDENCIKKATGEFKYGLKQRRILEAALFHPFNQ
jgi:GH24 family phage-related lysozyme (muramidase)